MATYCASSLCKSFNDKTETILEVVLILLLIVLILELALIAEIWIYS